LLEIVLAGSYQVLQNRFVSGHTLHRLLKDSLCELLRIRARLQSCRKAVCLFPESASADDTKLWEPDFFSRLFSRADKLCISDPEPALQPAGKLRFASFVPSDKADSNRKQAVWTLA